jgi:hypothetical protein
MLPEVREQHEPGNNQGPRAVRVIFDYKPGPFYLNNLTPRNLPTGSQYSWQTYNII